MPVTLETQPRSQTEKKLTTPQTNSAKKTPDSSFETPIKTAKKLRTSAGIAPKQNEPVVSNSEQTKTQGAIKYLAANTLFPLVAEAAAILTRLNQGARYVSNQFPFYSNVLGVQLPEARANVKTISDILCSHITTYKADYLTAGGLGLMQAFFNRTMSESKQFEKMDPKKRTLASIALSVAIATGVNHLAGTHLNFGTVVFTQATILGANLVWNTFGETTAQKLYSTGRNLGDKVANCFESCLEAGWEFTYSAKKVKTS